MDEPLYKEWNKLLESENVSAQQSEFCFAELVTAYSAPLRFYHNLDHLRKLFSLFHRYKKHLTDTVTTGLSIFYHDAIYEANKRDNEEKSALLAVKRLSELQLPEARIESIAQCIRATSNHRLPDGDYSPDLPIFLDMDMSILATPNEEYRQYLWNVRRENRLFNIETFINSRRDWIKMLLKQHQIFLSKLFEPMEEMASVNLNWELRSGAAWLEEMEVKAS